LATIGQKELLKKKLALIWRMRDLTESTDLSNKQAEEHYIDLMTRREAIMKQLKAVDIQLAKAAPEDGANILLSQISEAAKEVLELDEEISKLIPKMVKGIKNRMKLIKNGKNLNKAYGYRAFGGMAVGSYKVQS